MTKREEHIATARIRHAAGESVDQLCYRMRADGLSKMDCIAVLHDVLGRKTGEVMRLVHHSSTWTDRRAADERTEATLIEFLKPLEGRSVSLDEMMPLLESGNWIVRLPKGSETLLREIVTARVPDLLPLIGSTRDVALTVAQIETLDEALMDEFCYSGLDGDSIPTSRGLMIATLIDACFDARRA